MGMFSKLKRMVTKVKAQRAKAGVAVKAAPKRGRKGGLGGKIRSLVKRAKAKGVKAPKRRGIKGLIQRAKASKRTNKRAIKRTKPAQTTKRAVKAAPKRRRGGIGGKIRGIVKRTARKSSGRRKLTSFRSRTRSRYGRK